MSLTHLGWAIIIPVSSRPAVRRHFASLPPLNPPNFPLFHPTSLSSIQLPSLPPTSLSSTQLPSFLPNFPLSHPTLPPPLFPRAETKEKSLEEMEELFSRNYFWTKIKPKKNQNSNMSLTDNNSPPLLT